MDPNATLEDMIRTAQNITRDNEETGKVDQDDAVDLAEFVQTLDAWLANKGFLPDQWQR